MKSTNRFASLELTDTSGRPRLIMLDFLRGIAATAVAALHVSSHGPIKIPDEAAMSVLFFFILSGFVITYAYEEGLQSQRIGLKDFIIARIARLYPLHIITMLTVFVLISIARDASIPIRTQCGAREFIEAMWLVHFMFGGSHCFNVPSWSITTEFWCGGIIVALSLPSAAKFRSYVIIVTVALFAWGETYGFMRSGPSQHLFGPICFVIGWLLCYFRPLRQSWPIFGSSVYVSSAAIMFAGVNNDFIYIILFALTIISLSNVILVGPKVAGVMSAFGDWSYGLYMWHWPLLLALGGVATVIHNKMGVQLQNSLAFQLIYLMILFPVAAISYRYIEVPAKRLIRQLTRVGHRTQLAKI